MAKFKGTGTLCNCMGQVKAEFVNGELVTEDEGTISFLLGKGYVPELDAEPKPRVRKE